jgi:hypothetical protein
MCNLKFENYTMLLIPCLTLIIIPSLRTFPFPFFSFFFMSSSFSSQEKVQDTLVHAENALVPINRFRNARVINDEKRNLVIRVTLATLKKLLEERTHYLFITSKVKTIQDVIACLVIEFDRKSKEIALWKSKETAISKAEFLAMTNVDLCEALFYSMLSVEEQNAYIDKINQILMDESRLDRMVQELIENIDKAIDRSVKEDTNDVTTSVESTKV